MRQCLEAGANTLLMVGGKGRCRLGWYAEMQEILLKKAGYSFEMITLQSPLPLKKNWRSFLERLRPVIGPGKGPRLLADLYAAFLKAHYLDLGEELLFYWRAREKSGKRRRPLWGILPPLKEARRPGQSGASMPLSGRVAPGWKGPGAGALAGEAGGEIYAVYEDFVNGNLAKALGSLEDPHRGKKGMAMKWLRKTFCAPREATGAITGSRRPLLLFKGTGGRTRAGEHRPGRPGFPGGFRRVVHLWPFTCMPEIIAQNIMTRISRRRISGANRHCE